jgi:aldose 1-epimerase
MVWGTAPCGSPVTKWRLESPEGLAVEMMDWGATVVRIQWRGADVALGCPDLAGFLAGTPYFGCTVGRFGNRISDGGFEIDGRRYELELNDSPNGHACHLHGGKEGFDKRLWRGEAMEDGVRFSLTSPDGDQGYPGELAVTVEIRVQGAALTFDYSAETTAATHVNLTNHTYFNLAGGGDVLDHEIEIAASRFTVTDPGMIPTGELRPVNGTPFDFTTARRIGDRIDAEDDQIRNAPGYDHNWALDPEDGLRFAARLRHAGTGRQMEVWTTEPGLQLYTGNFLSGKEMCHTGPAALRGGLCLETQKFPDAPHRPEFPSTLLRPGESLASRTEYRFEDLG